MTEQTERAALAELQSHKRKLPERPFGGHGRALKEPPPIPLRGYCRKAQILRELPISSSYFDWAVRAGYFPRPFKVGGSNLWRAQDIHALFERIERGELAGCTGAPKKGREKGA